MAQFATLQTQLLNFHLDIKENSDVKPYSVEMRKAADSCKFLGSG